jgi:methylglutaconyl-CoA hydratase
VGATEGIDDELVHFSQDAGIVTITLDSQHNRNALSRALLEQLHANLDRAEALDARAIVVTHAGPAFCAGADLKERSSGPPDSGLFVEALERLMDTPRPTVAAVHGAARAGGIGLMAACDLVVVDSSVTFALTEVRIGVAAAIISVPILRRVPSGKIAAAMLTGEPFDAAEALAMGLVTHVTDQVDVTVARLCEGVLAGAAGAVAATKALLHQEPARERRFAFEQMQVLSDRLFSSPDAAEGMAAFREKRKPNWAATTPASTES